MTDNLTNCGKNQLLLIDDDGFSQKLMEESLKEEFDLLFANNGKDGILSAIEIKPDLILLDITMPGLSGYAVIEELKRNEVTKPIPVIFVSHLNEDYNEEKGLLLGADDYIIKPIRPGVMIARIRNILDRRRAEFKHPTTDEIITNTKDSEQVEKKHYLKPEQVADLKRILDLVLIKEGLFAVEDLRAAQVASAMGIKPHHLQELLNFHLKISFVNLLNKIRIEKAIELMKTSPGKKIIDIAHETGFQSKSSFNRAFKNITGNSPTDYKNTTE